MIRLCRGCTYEVVNVNAHKRRQLGVLGGREVIFRDKYVRLALARSKSEAILRLNHLSDVTSRDKEVVVEMA